MKRFFEPINQTILLLLSLYFWVLSLDAAYRMLDEYKWPHLVLVGVVLLISLVMIALFIGITHRSWKFAIIKKKG